MNDAIRMQLSAFVDGELPENEAELLLRRMSQDAELRQEVAEHLALGRLMRGQSGLAGADRLHERIAAVVDDRPVGVDDPAEKRDAVRSVRPLVGIAIAASVALVAIFALQQPGGIDELPMERPVARSAELLASGVPSIDAQLERQRQYFRSHAETSSRFGANGMNSLLVTLRFSEGFEENPAAEETPTDDSEPRASQP